MPNGMEFLRRSDAVMELYRAGQYPEALRIAVQLAAEFPDDDATTSLWRVCLLSRTGRTDEALKTMAEAMERGNWWSDQPLRADDDLSPLQGLPAFESMVKECIRRRLMAVRAAKPELLVRIPSSAPPFPLVIALHGAGTTAAQCLPDWMPAVELGFMLAVPQSAEPGSPGAYVWDDLARALEQVSGQFRELLKGNEVDTERVIVAGFSQGAALAVQLVLRRRISGRGFLAVAPGRQILHDLDEIVRTGAGARGYFILGGRDRRHNSLAEIHALLNQRGVTCELEDHPELGHELPSDFRSSLAAAFNFLMTPA